MQTILSIIVLLAFAKVNVNAFHWAKPLGANAAQRVTTFTSLNAAADITAGMVKELRDKSGAGMMDCKKALVENDGNLEGAVDWLRKKGIASVAKKADRIASTGLVAVARSADNRAAAIVEVNSETDFVAKNEMFQTTVGKICTIAAEGADTEDKILSSPFSETAATVKDEMTRLVATIGENMNFRRVDRLSVTNGVVSTYLHGPLKPNMGKIGVIVAVESTATDKEALLELGKNIAMHVCVNTPEFLDTSSVDPVAAAREKKVLVDQAEASGRPAAAIEKMVEGRMLKYFAEVCLLEQPFVMDAKMTVKQIVAQTAKDLGAPIEITGYRRMVLGDGMEVRDWTQ